MLDDDAPSSGAGKRGGADRPRHPQTRRPTMTDVAAKAGVSQTTVSLVLNHADGARLSQETRRRVMKAAASLGYQTVRRGAATSAATTIGFVCDELSTDPWTAIGLDGVREKAWAHGLTVTVMATRGDPEMEAAALRQMAALPLAGLVYAAINTRLVEAPAWTSPAPLVLLNCHAAGGAHASVVPGEVAGGHAGADVLIRAGHRRIGYINGEASMEAARHRLRGYRQALATADLPFDPLLAREGNWQPLSGYQATRALMALPSPPTAIFCANDLMAVGCYEALRELGLKIPDDVAVMGYDDREIAQHLHPPLTTVLLPHLEMGALAAELLIDGLSGDSMRPRQIKVECPIVMRLSV
jgi:LacI family transcriptional regulator